MIDPEKYSQMLREITPKYVAAVFAFDDCPVPLIGESIKRHLSGCGSVLICAATLGEQFDRLLRQTQLESMAGAVVLDSLGGKYIGEFCNQKDAEVIENAEHRHRYSPGYGDFPLSVNRDIISVLNASKRIGLHITDSLFLTPQKSITGIVGIT